MREVTVVIPTRNRWALLERSALRAALGQEQIDHEVVVVDDASTDGTSERLEELQDGRIQVVRLDERQGVAAARNAGIAAARGEWVAFLDDDDLWSPLKLRMQLDAARRAEAVFAYAGVVSVDDVGTARYAFSLPEPDGLLASLLSSSVLPAGCSNVLARTQLVRDLGGFDVRLFQLADWDLWIRLAEAGPAAWCEEPLVGYAEHAENMLLTDPRDVTEEFAYFAAKHSSLRASYGVELDRAAFAHWVAWGHLRRRRRLRAARVYLRSGLENRRPHDVALAGGFALRAALPLGRVRPALQRLTGTSPGAACHEPAWLELYR